MAGVGYLVGVFLPSNLYAVPANEESPVAQRMAIGFEITRQKIADMFPGVPISFTSSVTEEFEQRTNIAVQIRTSRTNDDEAPPPPALSGEQLIQLRSLCEGNTAQGEHAVCHGAVATRVDVAADEGSDTGSSHDWLTSRRSSAGAFELASFRHNKVVGPNVVTVPSDKGVKELAAWCKANPERAADDQCRALGQPTPPTEHRRPQETDGAEAPAGLFDPFTDVVMVGHGGTWRCTGVQVAPRFVLTAAHCLPATAVRTSGEVSEQSGIYLVTDSHRAPARADAALLELERPLPGFPRPWRLPNQNEPPEALVTIVGFGANDYAGTTGFGILRRNTLVANGWDCDRWKSRLVGCQPSKEMVLRSLSGNDTCRGDSGGPVFESIDGETRLLAITSRPLPTRGVKCGSGGIYVRLDAIAAWILKVIGTSVPAKEQQHDEVTRIP